MEALIEFRKKNYAVAREAVLQVLKVAPNHQPAVLLAGAVEYALGSHVQAQAYLTRARRALAGQSVRAAAARLLARENRADAARARDARAGSHAGAR